MAEIHPVGLPIVGTINSSDISPDVAAGLQELPLACDVCHCAAARWLVRTMMQRGITARADGPFVCLEHTRDGELLRQLWLTIPSVPPGCTLLGEADGDLVRRDTEGRRMGACLSELAFLLPCGQLAADGDVSVGDGAVMQTITATKQCGFDASPDHGDSVAILCTDDTPTQSLDLRRDALLAAGASVLTILEQLCYLKDLARTCTRFGYSLPYTSSELNVALDLLRDVAGRVRQEA